MNAYLVYKTTSNDSQGEGKYTWCVYVFQAFEGAIKVLILDPKCNTRLNGGIFTAMKLSCNGCRLKNK